MTVVNTNVRSSVAQDSLMKVGRDLSTAMERLSTGKRINRPKTMRLVCRSAIA